MALNILGPGDEIQATDVFLAGGISNCPDWQTQALALFETAAQTRDITVANPRRAEGLETTGPEAERQITWEHAMLSRARLVSFWFPKETLCPITLLELGIQMGRARTPLIIAAEAKYGRRFDLKVQVALARETNPHLPPAILPSIEAMVEESLVRLPF